MRADGHSPADYGAVSALNGLLIVVLSPLATPWLLRRLAAHALAAGTLLMGAATLLIALEDGLGAYAAACALITVGEIAIAVATGGLIGELAPPALRGRYAGAFGVTFGIAFTI